MEQGADLHMVQLKPLPLTVFCFSKIQIGFTFLVLAHPCSPGQRAIKWGVRTYKRGTVNRGTVKRGQLIAGQLIARTHNRADT